jgi:hypothetical protein
MARTHAAIRLDIWGDDDWRKLSMSAQYLYLHLLASPTLNYAGVADWRPARIAGMSSQTPRDIIELAAAELEAALFIIVDDKTEEVLIRSFLKHDGLLQKPNVAKAMVSAYTKTVSATLRGVIVFELNRLAERFPEWRAFDLKEVQEVMAKGSVNPFEKGSMKGSEFDPSLLTPNSLLPTPDSTHLATSEIELSDTARLPLSESDVVMADAMGLCVILADLIEANGSKRPTITKAWHNAARLMLTNDGRHMDKAADLIRWSQQDSFWRSNILSMPKFREKYDQLRLQAEQERASRKPTQSDKFHATLQMGRDLQAQLDAQALAGSTLREIA